MTNRQKQILHILRNPQKWTGEQVQQAQLDAADVLWKCWEKEEACKIAENDTSPLARV